MVEITDAQLQRDVWEVRKAGLNIMMSMKGDGKPVSFIEDCAVPLEHLAEYTDRLTRVFEKHGTRGTWYAHASVGTLHVRPVLDMRRDGAEKMRAIAEEACAMVQAVQGRLLGRARRRPGALRVDRAVLRPAPHRARSARSSRWFDPRGLMNPGKIVAPAAAWTTASLFRFKPGLRTRMSLDSVARLERVGRLRQGRRDVQQQRPLPQVRRRHDVPVVPRHARRGAPHARPRQHAAPRALGPARRRRARVEAVNEALDLCVSCKGCKRECPTGVDMARMKIEFLAHYKAKHGYTLRDRAIAYLPRYAPWAARFAPLANCGRIAWASASLGFAVAAASCRRWRGDYFEDRAREAHGSGREVVLFADTFNRCFEPENARAAVRVLEAAGYSVQTARPLAAGRPLCCGRTFLTAGMVDEARTEARRTLDALRPYLDARHPGRRPRAVVPVFVPRRVRGARQG